jgi:hypothetical protein
MSFRQSAAQYQILRLGLTLLNHKPRIAPTTTTKRIVSFIMFPLQLFSVASQHD